MSNGNYQLFQGDCLSVMAGMEAGSVDAVVTDPPYGLAFMGEDWDHGVPGEHFWREALRIAKPGAHLLAFGGTRTFHRLVVAIEDAEWEIRDTIMWVYGSGFPKSHNVGKAIDREAGAERTESVWYDKYHDGGTRQNLGDSHMKGYVPIVPGSNGNIKTLPATPEARQWDGWGTALKPAWEPIIVARKPLEGTVAQNVLKYGTGAINVDGCRVSHDEPIREMKAQSGGDKVYGQSGRHESTTELKATGRWPSNLIHDGSDDVLALFPQAKASGVYTGDGVKRGKGNWVTSFSTPTEESQRPSVMYADTGSAARFFYTAKADKKDRNDGCEGLEEREAKRTQEGGDDTRGRPIPRNHNHHPTVKPLELMRYLCKLVTPSGGIVLDPFMGSGSTGRAAVLEGFGFIGIDLESDYVAIAQARIAKATQMAAGQFVDKRGTEADFDNLPMFGGGQ